MIPKTRDLQRNVTSGHGCRFKFCSASLLIALSPHVGVSICKRICHACGFLASDQRCISIDPRRLVDTFGLALELLNSTLRCSSFFYQSFCSNCTTYRGGSFAQSIMQHASSKCGAVFAAHMHPKI